MSLFHPLSRLSAAVILSVFLHGTAGMGLWIHDHLGEKLMQRTPPSGAQKTLIMEFVPSPKGMEDRKPLKKTRIISEKDHVAQNPVSKIDLPKDEPLQFGTSESASLKRSYDPLSAGSFLLMWEQARSLRKPERMDAEGRKAQDYETRQEGREKLERGKLKKGVVTAPLAKPDIVVPTASTVIPDELSAPAQLNPRTAAEILDEWSYNSQSHAVARYFSKEIKKISYVWNLQILSSNEFAYKPFTHLKKTVVVFKIMPDGTVRDLQVIEHEGDELAMRYPVVAIEKCAPLPPLPDDVLAIIRTDGLWVRIEFNYGRS